MTDQAGGLSQKTSAGDTMYASRGPGRLLRDRMGGDLEGSKRNVESRHSEGAALPAYLSSES